MTAAESLIIETTLKNTKELKKHITDVGKLLGTVENSLGGLQQMGKGSNLPDSQQLLGIMSLINESQSSIQRMVGQLLYALTTEALRDGLAASLTSQKEPSVKLLPWVPDTSKFVLVNKEEDNAVFRQEGAETKGSPA